MISWVPDRRESFWSGVGVCLVDFMACSKEVLVLNISGKQEKRTVVRQVAMGTGFMVKCHRISVVSFGRYQQDIGRKRGIFV